MRIKITAIFPRLFLPIILCWVILFMPFELFAQKKNPDILFILVDDLGWNGLQ